jgi:hypothetical protein
VTAEREATIGEADLRKVVDLPRLRSTSTGGASSASRRPRSAKTICPKRRREIAALLGGGVRVVVGSNGEPIAEIGVQTGALVAIGLGHEATPYMGSGSGGLLPLAAQ